MNINLTLLAQAVMFAAFIWFTAKFIWPHLGAAIQKRQAQIADGLAAAERGKQELEQASVRTGDMLRVARQQVQDMLAQGDKRAAQIMEEAKVAASAEGERLVAAAHADIEQEISRAREALRAQVAALAVAGAEKILRREVNAQTHAELLASVRSQL
jgi:F-type H+-transporting ATPase subunit b